MAYCARYTKMFVRILLTTVRIFTVGRLSFFTFMMEPLPLHFVYKSWNVLVVSILS
ncbi:hypothetical protein C0J52_02428 [Blattella germanica]|nr:hypothetical protein C0J52_02428 [Blattella germanica]